MNIWLTPIMHINSWEWFEPGGVLGPGSRVAEVYFTVGAEDDEPVALRLTTWENARPTFLCIFNTRAMSRTAWTPGCIWWRLPSFYLFSNDIYRTPDSLRTLLELSQSKITSTFELTFLFKWFWLSNHLTLPLCLSLILKFS